MLISALKSALSLWWHNLVHFTFFHFAWIICQFLIIPAPAATATLYWLVVRFQEGEMVTFRDAWLEFRALFIPAWKWGAINLIAWAGAVGILWLAQQQIGIFGAALTFAVLILLAGWLALNLIYWALWFQQEDQSLATTYRNALVLLAYSPASVLLLLLVSLLIIVVSVLTVLPLIHVIMVWLAVLSTIVTQRLVRSIPQR
jgi:hypothetical protein